MNVLLIGNFSNPSWDGSIPDERNIAEAFDNFGHGTTRLQRESINGKLGIDEKLYDFILVFQWSGYPDGMFDGINVPVIYWAFDYQADGQPWHEELIRQSTLYLSKRFADSRYPNWRWACDFAPDFLGKHPPMEKEFDLLFTGSWLPWATERNETLKLLNEKFDLTICSANPQDWPDEFTVQPAVLDEGLPHLIASAKINIAIDHTIEAGYWSDRAAQIIACGGFCLQRYVQGMESYFHSNIVYFHSPEDAVERVEYWLDRDEDREVLAGEAWDVSYLYMCKQRVADVITIVEEIL